MNHQHCCNLCGDLHGQPRTGRLGRYAVTCDVCEDRRGSHLVKTVHGYANRANATRVGQSRQPVAA